MAQFDLYFTKLLEFEEGKRNKKVDKNGKTIPEVTLKLLNNYREAKGLPEATVAELDLLTQEDIYEIYKLMYWDHCFADDIENQSTAEIIVDWFICLGLKVVEVLLIIFNIPGAKIINELIEKINTHENREELFNRIKRNWGLLLSNLIKIEPEKENYYNKWIERKDLFYYVA